MYRLLIKKAFSTASMVSVLPLYLSFRLFSFICDKDSLLTSYSQFLSLYPGKTGSYLRNSFYQLTLTQCESGIVFSFGTLLSQCETEIATGTYIGPQCNIGSCKIGKDCLIGSGVHIISGKNQHFIDDPEIAIRDQGGELTPISIGNDCWKPLRDRGWICGRSSCR